MKLDVYTDGACLGNPGPGGWGAVVYREGVIIHEMSGGEAHTTNNRMELMGVLETLRHFQDSHHGLTIVSDSKYVVNNVPGLATWASRGWKGANKKPVKNPDLWQEMYAFCAERPVTFRWVRGHSGNEGNERADYLATTKAKEYQN